MAREESDREDLMREATALVRRAELDFPERDDQETVIVGFRRDGRLAVYFGPDPVYQFDEFHRLRRAYAGGFLYRTQGETLARLTRKRTETETQLIRRDLDADELAGFRQTAKSRLSPLEKAIAGKTVRVVSQVPAEGDLLGDLGQALRTILDQNLPLAPAFPGKR